MEARVLPAGNVTVEKVSSPDGIDLVITGDGSANKIEIYQTSLDNYIVVGKSLSGATKINGVSGRTFRFSLGEISDDIRIDMNGGNDQVTVRGSDSSIGDLDVEGDLRVDLGSGNDVLTLKYLDIYNDLYVDLGTGIDKLDAQWINVDDDATVRSPLTDRTLVKQTANFTNFNVGDVFEVDLNYSLAVVNIINARADELNVYLGSGTDKLSIATTQADAWDVRGGDGYDYYNSYRNLSPISTNGFESFSRKSGKFS